MERKQKNRNRKRLRVQRGVRRRVRGDSGRPRLCVFRSNRNLACQAIDDSAGRTLVSISSLEKELAGRLQGSKSERAKTLGEEMARRLLEKGVEQVVFDRGWYRYHGRIKVFADAVREGGVRF